MKGYIEVHLPPEAENLTLQYEKLADAEMKDVEYEKEIKVEDENVGKITGLESGLYRIQVSGDSEYEFAPSVISVPLWNEEEKEMQYDITVIPKYRHHTVVEQSGPKTGDESSGVVYSLFGIISFIIIIIISCHNRLKCVRMSNMYTKRWRT